VTLLWLLLLQDPARLIDSGNAKLKKGDYDAAIADFSKAIEADAKCLEAYCFRGLAKIHKGDFAGAVADYDKAIELHPEFAPAYASRGVARHESGDAEGAISDFTRAMELDPKDAKAPLDRAYARVAKKDLEGAIEDFSKAIALNAKFGHAYFGRGCARYDRREWKEALADFRKACDLDPQFRDYGRLRIWLILARTGERDKGDAELARYLKDRKTGSDWYLKIANFLMGKLPEAEFMKAGLEGTQVEREGRAQKCEAYYYGGMKRLIDGDKDGARELFKKCLDTGVKEITAYASAQAELDALDK
jgi:tetratricopeptide (TPR) repeat protein